MLRPYKDSVPASQVKLSKKSFKQVAQKLSIRIEDENHVRVPYSHRLQHPVPVQSTAPPLRLPPATLHSPQLPFPSTRWNFATPESSERRPLLPIYNAPTTIPRGDSPRHVSYRPISSRGPTLSQSGLDAYTFMLWLVRFCSVGFGAFVGLRWHFYAVTPPLVAAAR
ncbi:hypothetical protein MMC24_007398 [Lignoscripta atroalba]|nr:hypothetical protein [Lignoscripta atroalba]